MLYFFFQAEDGIRDGHVTGVQTCALPILVLYETGLSFKDILQIYEDFYKNYGFDSVDKQEATLGEGNIRLMFTGYKDGELINTVLTHVKQEKKRQVQIQISEDPFYEPSEDED